MPHPSLISLGGHLGPSLAADSLFTSTPDGVIHPAGVGHADTFGPFFPVDCSSAPFLAPYVPPSVTNISLEELEWNSLLTLPSWTADLHHHQPTAAATTTAFTPSPAADATSYGAAWQPSPGLLLPQVDSVEGKCLEIREYLCSSQTGLDARSVSKYITRDRLVACVQSYGVHYQAVQPILHLPTFELGKTSPILLVAIMLVGACYSDDLMPPSTIVQCAIHVLLLIERSPVSFCPLHCPLQHLLSRSSLYP